MASHGGPMGAVGPDGAPLAGGPMASVNADGSVGMSLWKPKHHAGAGQDQAMHAPAHYVAPPEFGAPAAGPLALAELQQRVDQLYREKLALEGQLTQQHAERARHAHQAAAQYEEPEPPRTLGPAEGLLEARGPNMADRVRYIDPRVVAYSRYMDPDIPCPTIDASAIGRQLYEEASRLPKPEEIHPGDPGCCAKPVAFTAARPSYRKQDDVWERTLALRLLDEAVRGNVSAPMPAPAVFAEDYENYREGKYVKDDCWLA